MDYKEPFTWSGSDASERPTYSVRRRIKGVKKLVPTRKKFNAKKVNKLIKKNNTEVNNV